jgi:Membrane-bound metallopeptidase
MEAVKDYVNKYLIVGGYHMLKKISSAFLITTLILFFTGPIMNMQAATTTSTAGVVNLTSGLLNVRASASSSATILTTVSKGTYITLISRYSSGWWKVEYSSGCYGYVSSSFITQVSGASAGTINVSSGYVNIRSGPSTSYSVMSVLPSGKIVIVLSKSGSFSKILYDGTKIGYVSSQYLNVNSSMIWPVPASSRITQNFSSTHLGIDIGAKTPGVSGDSIVAATSGTVAYSGWLSGYGNVVYINSYYNGKYIQTRYGHMKSAPYVSVGSTVSAGQTVGAMGNTGTSTAVHLHFEVRIRNSSAACTANADSTAVNPLSYVSY